MPILFKKKSVSKNIQVEKNNEVEISSVMKIT
jgi:hypothetical protein